MGVVENAKDLAVQLTGTKEFAEVKQAKAAIDKNRALKNKVEDYKKKEALLYSGRFSSNEMPLKTAELKKLLEELSSVPEIERFLNAEKNFNALLQNVYKTIGVTLETAFDSR